METNNASRNMEYDSGPECEIDRMLKERMKRHGRPEYYVDAIPLHLIDTETSSFHKPHRLQGLSRPCPVVHKSYTKDFAQPSSRVNDNVAV